MRKKVIAGNWKMHMDLNESVNLISELKQKLSSVDFKADVVVCPPFTSLETTYTLIKESSVKLGAQNMHFEDSGAFTGEVSADMLKSVGAEYVILGHSERRSIFGEKNETINKKITKAVEKGLKPIFCIGESLEERENNETFNVIEKQISEGLKSLSEADLKDLIIAYEPVWAIGTGKTATPEQAQEVHAFIRKYVKENLSGAFAEKLVIQYGGSVKPNNAKELLSQEDIDGALVGGACLKADDFSKIIQSA